MKRILSVILLGILLLGLCGCSISQPTTTEDPNAKIEKALEGEWIWKEHDTNPIYMFLRFKGKEVRYGTNLFGQEIESGTWDCSYSIKDTTLELTTSDGTVFEFELQMSGDEIRIFNDDGKEFVRSN